MFSRPVASILVPGGGSADLLAALTLRRRFPALGVRSTDLGTTGVGEGTTKRRRSGNS